MVPEELAAFVAFVASAAFVVPEVRPSPVLAQLERLELEDIDQIECWNSEGWLRILE